MVNHSKAIVRLPHLLWAPPLCFFSRLDAAETRCHRQQTHIAEPFVHSHKPTPCLTCQHLSVPGALFSGEPYGGPRAVLWRCLTGCRCIVALIRIHCGNITIPPLRARRRMTQCHCYQSSKLDTVSPLFILSQHEKSIVLIVSLLTSSLIIYGYARWFDCYLA